MIRKPSSKDTSAPVLSTPLPPASDPARCDVHGRQVQQDFAPAHRRATGSRTWRGSCFWAAVGLSVCAPNLQAQEAASQKINLQHFAPLQGAGDYVRLYGGSTPGNLKPSFGLYMNYASNLLAAKGTDGSIVQIIHTQAQADVLAGLGIGKRFELGVGVPYTLALAGDDLSPLGLTALPAQTLGDIRLFGRAAILSSDSLNLAAVVSASLPTGDPEALQGKGGVAVQPTLIGELKLDAVRAVLNLGYSVQPEQSLLTLTVGNELNYGLGVNVNVLENRMDLIAEIAGKASQNAAGEMSSTNLPVELGLAVRLHLADAFHLTLGGGPGLSTGYGSPAVRTYAGLSYSKAGTPSKPSLKDADLDGLLGDADKCPTEAEDKDAFQDDDGCPELDNDADGLADTQDKCPGDAEDKDNFEDTDGCPEIDNDGDGVIDAADQCPLKPELINQIDDGDGCPEGDQDNDGIVDPVDKCPAQAELTNGIDDKDGCPEPDQDSDGIIDASDKCPKKAENKNGFQDEDGCPEADQDNDGLIDSKDKCPKKPETANGFKDEDGCPDEAPAQAKPSEAKPAEAAPTENKAPEMKSADGGPVGLDTAKAVEKSQAAAGVMKTVAVKPMKLLVFFGADAPSLDVRSQELLSKTATWLVANPSQKAVVQGFSDDTGNVTKDLESSKARAEAVKTFLVDQGVKASQLEVKAVGSKFPRAGNDTEQGKAQNRRVRILPVDKAGKVMENLPEHLEVALPPGF